MNNLKTENLIKKYKARTVVNNVSLQINSGEVVGLLGPNGAGKTTTFYSIVGFIKPDGGVIEINGTDLTAEPMYKRARRGISYLPQEASIFRELTVYENLSAILETLRLSGTEIKSKADSLINEFNLSHVRNNKGKNLSGGERRRAEIARALTISPKFLLLDEPFAGVDPISIEDIKGLIMKLKTNNIGVLITDHNVRDTLSIVDRAYIMYEGNILVEGTADDLINSPEAKKLYLGESFKV